MKFFKRVVAGGGGGGLHPQHQSLDDNDEDAETLERKLSEDSQTTSSASTHVTSSRETSFGVPAENGTPPLDSSFLASPNDGREPVWKRRVRAHQASLPREARTTSIPETPDQFDASMERKDSVGELNTSASQDISNEQEDFDEADHLDTSQQTYSRELKEGPFIPSSPAVDNSILQSTISEASQNETVQEPTSPRKTNGLMEKMMNPSFRKSVMASKNKAWKSVLACHRPDLPKNDFPDDDEEEVPKNGASTDLPFWKRLEQNLFSSNTNEPQEAETSFESTSSAASGELLTFLKRAGTSLTGFVKESTAACTQPQHDDDEGVSFDDQSSNGSTLDSRTVSKASTAMIPPDDRRLWQELFEDENEHLSLEEEEATNPGSM